MAEINTVTVQYDKEIPDYLVHKKRPNRFAYLDKHATKELPGTMEALRRDANKASEMHMTYGQYKSQEWLANGRR